MPKVVIAALAVIGALILFFGSFAISSAISHNWVSGLHWDNPSLADIPDGVYLAEYYHEFPAGNSDQVYVVN